ncbi:hypothetical protein AX16_010108 [Volvariella volvacea WC 439]|nr:hypothetical protein AX16_010108 [Volvariella volvacea WC 439]
MSIPYRPVKLTVINDLICPNCCIGQHELLNAIQYCTETLNLPLAFEVVHMPFRLISKECLADDSPKVEKSAFYSAKFGKDRFSAFETSIAKWGEEKGIPISFRGVMSQSTRAHRLSQKAYQIGGQNFQVPLLCALFKAYLEEGQDIADIDVLSDIAANVGVMTKDQVCPLHAMYRKSMVSTYPSSLPLSNVLDYRILKIRRIGEGSQ